MPEARFALSNCEAQAGVQAGRADLRAAGGMSCHILPIIPALYTIQQLQQSQVHQQDAHVWDRVDLGCYQGKALEGATRVWGNGLQALSSQGVQSPRPRVQHV